MYFGTSDLRESPGATWRHMSVGSRDSPVPAHHPPESPGGVTETYLWLLAGGLQSWHILRSFAIQISALNPGAPAEAAQQMDRLQGEVSD